MHVVMVFHWNPDHGLDEVDVTLIDAHRDDGYSLDDPEGRDLMTSFITMLNRCHPEIVTEALAYFN